MLTPAKVTPRNVDGKPNPQLSTHKVFFARHLDRRVCQVDIARSQCISLPTARLQIRMTSTVTSQSPFLASIDQIARSGGARFLCLLSLEACEALAHAKKLILEGAALVRQVLREFSG